MIEGLSHVGTDHKCTICQCDFTDDEGGVQGYLGILPVAFCPFCLSGLFNMIGQLDEREWEGLTDDEVKNFVQAVWPREATATDYIRAIEAKLKEKNYEST